ncbi:hypothetical protein D5S17_25415 [Pseudonocardiaceae bacterium YIM PH 21723]|nr:hypothetical protein D5S17_25415 [Pseudonocardiaceae bacterium YIM PH 21723]
MPMVAIRNIRTMLIAGRGELARRVMRTAAQMGIRTVAVYHPTEANAPHVRDADLAMELPGNTLLDAYRDAGAILRAAWQAGADAVHPGDGPLAGSARFSADCAAQGLVFLGPQPQDLDMLSTVDTVLNMARVLGIPVLPAEWRADPMRLAGELGRVRRIEVPVFGDHHGTAVHLLDRESSIQLRGHILLAEAPSAGVSPTVRAAMGLVATTLTTELGYVGPAIAEFLVPADNRDIAGQPEFFLLGMGSRLGPGHAATEAVTGIDVFRSQLEVAMGGPLLLDQVAIVEWGHAVEARLHADQSGLLSRYEHDPRAGVHFEDCVRSGLVMPPGGTGLLSAITAHASSRSEAIARLARALARMRLHGPSTNRELLVELLDSVDFQAGLLHTDYTDDYLASRPAPSISLVHLAAAVVTGCPAGSGQLNLRTGDQVVRVEYLFEETDLKLVVDGRCSELILRELDADGALISMDGLTRHCRVHRAGDGSTWVNDADHQSRWVPAD